MATAAGYVGLGIGKFIIDEDSLSTGKKFEKWLKALERSMRLAKITSASLKVDAFYQQGGEHLEEVATNLPDLPPLEVGQRNAYEEVREKLLLYWTPKKNKSHTTMIFMRLSQNKGETTQSYVVCLREAATDFDFGEAAVVNRRIREQIPMNGNNIKLRQRAMEKDWDLNNTL